MEDKNVQDFICYFAAVLTNWEVKYNSNFRRIQPADRRFHVTGVEQALAQYTWPASFKAPENMNGYSYEKGRDYCCYRWDSTLNALTYLRAGLQQAVQGDDDERTLRWCEAILRWGLGNRWRRPNQRLLEINQNPRFPGISRYLGHVSRHLVLESVTIGDITSDLIPYSCSGFAKIFCLASDDGQVILDSRVSAALGECVNHFLRGSSRCVIPEVLRIPRGASLSHRVPTPVIGDVNHPVFTHDYRWIRAQIRVSWLLHAVLERQPRVFHGNDLPLRAHKLEAALFMMGAQVGKCHQLPPVVS